MLSLTDFENLKMIHEGNLNSIYSGIRKKDRKEVILKALRSLNPESFEIALMYHEFEITKDLNLDGVVKVFDLIEEKNRYALIEEDFAGISLKDFLGGKPIGNLEDFYKIALQIVAIIGEIHRKYIIHKDIKPANLIINPKTLSVKLTDFNYASKLLHELQDVVPPEKLEGTLFYMAPEQTGRMNMNIDYRSDFYSLGVTLFEMLTGTVPFSSKDPLELVHAHLAISPPEATAVNPSVPPILSEIIKKLMAKDPADRYQSAIGILADLERCNKSPELFELGQEDVYDRLNLSQKLYGRENESKKLLEAYSRVSHGAVETLMVCGYSGIGKTMLINEVHKPMVKDKGYFISGKFDQLQKNTPYTAITQAFNQLARLIMSEPEERFEVIKQSILKAMGDVAQIIIELAPEMERVLGKQPTLPKLPPMETQNRMMIFFKRFIGAIANQDHPLVLFIDDLQWIDSGSLKLIEYIITDPELSHVLFIGAYRDNEVDEHHPLSQFFKAMDAKAIQIQSLPLGPLTTKNFEDLFMDSFNRTREEVQPFAELIHKRTNGNPFFCKQVITALYKQKLLFFDYAKRRWDWNLEGIIELKITENVVDLMLTKLQELPPETQQLLKYGACVGNRFTIDILKVISGLSPEVIGKSLWHAMQLELIVTLNLGYKRIDAITLEKLSHSISKEVTYQFIHDRVQQAVYQMLSDDEKRQTHLTIARLLMEKEPEASRKERLFEVVDHFNQAHELLNPEERLEVANLNYEASQRALNANAYQPMTNYVNAALSLMDESWWEKESELTFKVHRQQALCLFLSNKVVEAEELTKALLERAKTNMEKVSLYRIQLMSYITRDEVDNALKTGATALELLGVKYTHQPSKINNLFRFLQVQWYLRKYNPETLDKELPELTDPNIIAAFDILNELAYPAFWRSTEVFTETGLAGFELVLRYGKPQGAGWWVWSYGFIQLKLFKNTTKAFLYLKIAEKLYEEVPHKYTSGMAYDCTGYFVYHWKYHEKSSADYYLRGVQDSTESGNVLVAAVAKGDLANFHNWALSKSLKTWVDGLKSSLKIYTDLQYSGFIESYAIGSIMSENLLTGEHSQSEKIKELEQTMEKMQNLLMQMISARFGSFYSFFMEFYEQNLNYHNAWYAHEELVKVDALTPEIEAIDSIMIMKLLPTMTGLNKWKYEKRLRKIGKYLKWAASEAPVNYLHHYLYFQGYQLKLKGRYYEAIQAFIEGIENAKKGDYYLWAALGNELAGELFIEQKQPSSAKDYIKESHYYYERYGMKAKTKSLEKRYPEYFVQTSSSDSLEATTSAGLDFLSIIKASQTISGEIIVEKLFEKMLRISLENAGAERAVFLEKQSGKNWIVAATLGKDFQMQNIPLKDFSEIPQSIIIFALRSKSPVVIKDAEKESQYAEDSYIKENHLKSVFCLPIVHHDTTIGLIYLENNLSAGSFTQERVTVLQALASQIAISLENARHFEHTQMLYRSTERFVPKAFLKLLKKEHVEDVKLGDSTEALLSVLFTDIRGYTTLTEKMNPQEAYAFINGYLKYVAPIIRAHEGFISQYQGDGIMALFPRNADDAMKAILDMADALIKFNSNQPENKKIQVGYGLNTGLAMLGTIGEEQRMDANVISDAINLASRIESLNKYYGTKFLMSDATLNGLTNPELYTKRIVDKVQVKGKKKPVILYEVYERGAADETGFITAYETAFKAYEKGDIASAISGFEKAKQLKPNDMSCSILIERCEALQKSGLPENWDGTFAMTHK